MVGANVLKDLTASKASKFLCMSLCLRLYLLLSQFDCRQDANSKVTDLLEEKNLLLLRKPCETEGRMFLTRMSFLRFVSLLHLPVRDWQHNWGDPILGFMRGTLTSILMTGEARSLSLRAQLHSGHQLSTRGNRYAVYSTYKRFISGLCQHGFQVCKH